MMMLINDYTVLHQKYLAEITGTGYLGFRDIPWLLKEFCCEGTALDLGCGKGRSTRFLKSLGFEAIGADISIDMLGQANVSDITGQYLLIESYPLPFLDSSFDLVFSSFLYFELHDKDEIIKILREKNRLLKPQGFIVIVAGTNYLFQQEWLTITTDFPENQAIKSGDIGKVYMPRLDLHLNSCYWSEADFLWFFEQSKLEIVKIHYPLGTKDDGFAWKAEYQYPPYVVFMLQKQSFS